MIMFLPGEGAIHSSQTGRIRHRTEVTPGIGYSPPNVSGPNVHTAKSFGYRDVQPMRQLPLEGDRLAPSGSRRYDGVCAVTRRGVRHDAHSE